MRSIHDAANASACGARSTMARRPSSGLGNRAILEKGFTIKKILKTVLLENPMLCRRAQRLQPLLTARLRIDAHHRFGPRQPVADPRPVAEHQLQSVGANHLAHWAPVE